MDISGLEVIKLEFILKLKIKRVRKQPIIALYFEFETVLKFYNLEARMSLNEPMFCFYTELHFSCSQF